MRLGRNFTNCLVFDYLTEDEKRGVVSGEIDLASMNALALEKAKVHVERQIEVAREMGMDHVELDAGVPNPYLDFDGARRRAIGEAARSNDVTLSLHLPYSYMGGALCCPKAEDRSIAVEYNRRCIEFAAEIGARWLVAHSGTVPSHHAIGGYRDQTREALVSSLLELGRLARDRDLVLCLENNTAFDGIFCEPDECLDVVEEVRQRGVDIYLNFDIGHWLTRADAGKPIPKHPEFVLEPLPPDVLKELHLNDYVPGERMFHPPLHLGWGVFGRGNLERYARLVKRKGVEVVVLETEMKSVEQVLDRYELLAAESKYIREIFEGA